jgi:hypothetical protein
MNKDDVKIGSPCTADWSEMGGDQSRRFCDQCDKSVHNLSALTEPEAKTLLKEPKICVRYTTNKAGDINFQPTSRRALLRRGAMMAGALTISLPAAAAMMTAEDASCDKPGLLTRLWRSVFSSEPEPMMGEPAVIIHPPGAMALPEPELELELELLGEPEFTEEMLGNMLEVE